MKKAANHLIKQVYVLKKEANIIWIYHFIWDD